MAHIDFATHLEHIGNIAALELPGNAFDGTQIFGDVFALAAVAARRAENELALFVAQRGRQPVDLRLRRHDQLVVFLEIEEPVNALPEIADIVFAEPVGERKHRHGMAHLAELLRRGRTDALARAVLAHKFRIFRLDRIIALAQCVIVGVADFGRVLLVVELVVMLNRRGQTRQLLRRLFQRQLFDRLLLRSLTHP